MFLFGFFLFGGTIGAQTSINCLYPFVPTDCSPCIDPSENMVEIESDCATGYTLTIGDPVLISGGQGNCPGATYTVTYTVNDDCGFSASCSQTWVIENEGPIIECPMDLYLDCGDPNNDIYIDYWLNSVQAQTTCGLIGMNQFNTYNPNWINGPCPSGFQTVTFFVTDACGRTNTCTATVFVLDHEEPVVIKEAEDLLAVCSYNTMGDFQDWLNSQGGAVVEDACSNVSWSTIPANPQLPLACHDIEVTFVATDGCGWSVSTTASFELIDCHPPIIIDQPSDMTVSWGQNALGLLDDWLADNGGATAIDECGTNIYWMTDPMDPELSDGCGQTGSVTVVFLAKDDCGNVAMTDPATFTIVDDVDPVFTSVPDDATIECGGMAMFGTPTAEDDCGTATITHVDTTTGTICDGSTTRTWTATDECGNTATATQTITYLDDVAPTPSYTPQDITIECDETPVFSPAPEWTDNCGGHPPAAPSCSLMGASIDLENTFQDDVVTMGVEFQFVAPMASVVDGGVEYSNFAGVYDVDVMATGISLCYSDNAVVAPTTLPDGRFDRYYFDLGSTTNQPISASLDPSSTIDAEVSIAGDGRLLVEIGPGDSIGFDLCIYVNLEFPDCENGLHTEVEDVQTDGPCPGEYVIKRTWSAIDGCGNLAVISQRIYVEDNTPPVFTFVPGDVTLDCGEDVDFGLAIAEDACSDVTITFMDVESSGFTDCNKTITRTWTAEDECGNTATAMTTATLDDNEAPEFTSMPQDMTVECGPLMFDDVEAEDACGNGVTITFMDSGSGTACDSTITRTWTAMDDCGNSAMISQTKRLIDTIAPVFTYVPPVLDITCALPPFDFEDPIAEDNCGDVTLTYVEEAPNGDICDEGAAYVRKYTATDQCGNTACVDVVVWVGPDTGGPEFTFVPTDLTFYCADGDPVIPDAIAVDDCDPNVVITFEDEFNTDPEDCGNGYGYDIIRTWTATDHCGRTTTAVTLAWVKGPLSINAPGQTGLNTNEQGASVNVEANALALSPNPAENQLNIAYKSNLEQRATIRIFDVLGKEVLSSIETAAKGINNSSLIIENFAPGTYVITLELQDQILTKKFIKR